jgi:hypothetical protein
VPAGQIVLKDSIQGTGCVGTSVKNMTIQKVPKPVINGKNQVCENAVERYQVNNVPNTIFKWQLTGGTIDSGQGTAQIKVTWGSPGNSSIIVSDSLNNFSGCKEVSNAFPIVINIKPTPVVYGPDTMCESGLAVYRTIASTNHALVWQVTNGTIVSGQGSDSLYISWGATGTGMVTLKDSNQKGGSGCRGSCPSQPERPQCRSDQRAQLENRR